MTTETRLAWYWRALGVALLLGTWQHMMSCKAKQAPVQIMNFAAETSALTVPIPSSLCSGRNQTGPTQYSDDGQQVIFGSDFGFYWLQATTLANGHIQVSSKCGPWPGSTTGYYSIGDCNGIGQIRISGSQVEGIAAGGNCAAKRGCPPTGEIMTRWFFSLPNFAYTGAANTGPDIPQGTRQADVQGRQWTVDHLGPSSCQWRMVSVQPTVTGTPPTATMTPAFQATATATARPTITRVPTPCSDAGAPCGRVGYYGWCYDCAGNILSSCVPPVPNRNGDPCIPKGSSPSPTRTAIYPTAIPPTVPAGSTPNVVCIPVTTTPLR